MFKLRTSDPSFLRNVLDSISSLVTEGTFKLSPTGMKLIAMDPAGAAMVILNINNTAFDSFEASDTLMTINLDLLLKILKRARPEDILVMEILDEENKLKILFQGNSVRNFLLPLIEPLDSEQSIPPLEFGCTLNITSKLFKDVVTDASMISEAAVFEASEKGFEMSSEGNSQGFHMLLNKETKGFSFEGVGRSRYGIDYLERMLKPSSFSDDLTIKFSTDYPVQLEYRVEDKLSLKFVLAPRTELD